MARRAAWCMSADAPSLLGNCAARRARPNCQAASGGAEWSYCVVWGVVPPWSSARYASTPASVRNHRPVRDRLTGPSAPCIARRCATDQPVPIRRAATDKLTSCSCMYCGGPLGPLCHSACAPGRSGAGVWTMYTRESEKASTCERARVEIWPLLTRTVGGRNAHHRAEPSYRVFCCQCVALHPLQGVCNAQQQRSRCELLQRTVACNNPILAMTSPTSRHSALQRDCRVAKRVACSGPRREGRRAPCVRRQVIRATACYARARA